MRKMEREKRHVKNDIWKTKCENGTRKKGMGKWHVKMAREMACEKWNVKMAREEKECENGMKKMACEKWHVKNRM